MNCVVVLMCPTFFPAAVHAASSSLAAPVYLFCHCLSVLPIGCRFVICVCFCVLVLFCVVARDLFVFVLHFAIVCPRVCVVFDFTDFVFLFFALSLGIVFFCVVSFFVRLLLHDLHVTDIFECNAVFRRQE